MWNNTKTVVEEHISLENVYLHSAGRWPLIMMNMYLATIINKQTSLNKPTSKLKLFKT